MDRSPGYDASQVDSREREAALIAGSGMFERAECGSCHAMSTEGGPAHVTLRDLRSRYTLEALTDYLATPREPMPPYDADIAQRRALAIYLLETY